MKFAELLVNINATMHIFMRIKSPTPPNPNGNQNNGVLALNKKEFSPVFMVYQFSLS